MIFLVCLVVVMLSGLPTTANSDLVINEVFPNPAGKDTDGEFIEIKNTGVRSIELTGYKLRDASMKEKGKTFELGGAIQPGSVLFFKYDKTKISLNNDGDTLELINSSGAIVSTVRYGNAREDQSWGWDGSRYIWGKPTAGSENIFETTAEKIALSKPIDVTPAGALSSPIQNKALGWAFIAASPLVAFLAFFIPGNKKVVGWWNGLFRNRKPSADSKLGS